MDILHFIEFAFIVIVGWTLSAMVLPRISLVSFRRRLFDSVDERKLHTAHIPRLGGIAFFPCITVTVSLAIIGYNLWQGNNTLKAARLIKAYIHHCKWMNMQLKARNEIILNPEASPSMPSIKLMAFRI